MLIYYEHCMYKVIIFERLPILRCHGTFDDKTKWYFSHIIPLQALQKQKTPAHVR